MGSRSQARGMAIVISPMHNAKVRSGQHGGESKYREGSSELLRPLCSVNIAGRWDI